MANEKFIRFKESRPKKCYFPKLLSKILISLTECGTDNICTFDLSVEVADSIPSPFVIGSTQLIMQTIRVKNQAGDPAYLPQMKIPMPREIEISKFPKGCGILVRLFTSEPQKVH
jgi:hypothetical protein